MWKPPNVAEMASLGGFLYSWVQTELQICSPNSPKITWISKKITRKITRKQIFTECLMCTGLQWFYKINQKLSGMMYIPTVQTHLHGHLDTPLRWNRHILPERDTPRLLADKNSQKRYWIWCAAVYTELRGGFPLIGVCSPQYAKVNKECLWNFGSGYTVL